MSDEHPLAPCPDFDLAELQGYDPTLLLGGKDSADSLVLVLAMAFNDLKGMMWVGEQLKKCKPAEAAVDARVGQWAGMNSQNKRLLTGILFELIVAMESADKKGLLDDPAVTSAVDAAGQSAKGAWGLLVAAARGKDGSGEMKEFISAVRNRSAFHYDRTLLSDGYRKKFSSDPKTALNEKAYCSVGTTMEQTRWHFVDAASQAVQEILDPNGSAFAEANEHFKAMNVALKHIVENYMDQKAATAEAKAKAM